MQIKETKQMLKICEYDKFIYGAVIIIYMI